MKVIIDIPEEEYMKIKRYYDNLPMYSTVEAELCYIAHGMPFDDVKAKIADIETYERDGCWVMTDVWKVLNNIGKESEVSK